MKRCVHFVGFRGEEYSNAVKVWGKPDFYHKYWDRRCLEDYDDKNDIMIFAGHDETKKFNPYTYNDSNHF